MRSSSSNNSIFVVSSLAVLSITVFGIYQQQISSHDGLTLQEHAVADKEMDLNEIHWWDDLLVLNEEKITNYIVEEMFAEAQMSCISFTTQWYQKGAGAKETMSPVADCLPGFGRWTTKLLAAQDIEANKRASDLAQENQIAYWSVSTRTVQTVSTQTTPQWKSVATTTVWTSDDIKNMPGYTEKMQALYADYKERALAVWVTPVSFEVFEQRYLAMLALQQWNTAVIPVQQPSAWAVNIDDSRTTTKTTVQQPTTDTNMPSSYKFSNEGSAVKTQQKQDPAWGRTLRF